MLYNKSNKLYGIDYNTYACGGIGSVKLMLLGEVRELNQRCLKDYLN